jgi:outer membrane lipoprotein-sorting protein
MKKLIFSMLILVPLTVRADDRGAEILRRMGAAFGDYDSYRVEFTATMAGEFDALPGTLIVSGEKYYLDVYDSEIFFDGRNGYTYSETNKEVIVETPDPDDNRLFANPANIFQLYERDFEAAYRGTTVIGGTTPSQLELTPRSADAGYNRIILHTDASNHPMRLVYRLDEYGKELTLNVLKIIPNIKTSPETFRFDPEKHPGVETIDFR